MFGRLPVDDFWKKIYDLMMTPLPPPKQLELDKFFEALRKVKPGEIPELPTAPEWMQRYVKERGLDQPQSQPANSAQGPMQSPQQPDTGLWGFLHPEGVGTTQRNFNAIYPPLGR